MWQGYYQDCWLMIGYLALLFIDSRAGLLVGCPALLLVHCVALLLRPGGALVLRHRVGHRPALLLVVARALLLVDTGALLLRHRGALVLVLDHVLRLALCLHLGLALLVTDCAVGGVTDLLLNSCTLLLLYSAALLLLHSCTHRWTGHASFTHLLVHSLILYLALLLIDGDTDGGVGGGALLLGHTAALVAAFLSSLLTISGVGRAPLHHAAVSGDIVIVGGDGGDRGWGL